MIEGLGAWPTCVIATHARSAPQLDAVVQPEGAAKERAAGYVRLSLGGGRHLEGDGFIRRAFALLGRLAGDVLVPAHQDEIELEDIDRCERIHGHLCFVRVARVRRQLKIQGILGLLLKRGKERRPPHGMHREL